MWFASIWVFTLGLPWTLGADFFLQQLLDGDPASNTLSWRWVSGLQTPGKTYLARAENIYTFTEGRFRSDGKLAMKARAIQGAPAPAPIPLAFSAPLQSGIPSILLLHDDDLCPETAPLPLDDIVGVALLNAARLRSKGKVAQGVYEFVATGLRDAVQRLPNGRDIATCDANANTIVSFAKQYGARRIVYPHAPVGPAHDEISRIESQIAKMTDHPRLAMEAGIRLWDANSWPHAKKGFFNFKKHIPSLIASIDH
jgi:deoxyribodipyrimidine photo-lyase